MRSRTTQGRHAIAVAATLSPGIAPRWAFLALAALLALATGPALAPPVAMADANCYTFTLLEQPEGARSLATAINNRGQVLGQLRTSDHGTRTVVWDGDQVREVGTLGGGFDVATAINDEGDVVGLSLLGETDQNRAGIAATDPTLSGLSRAFLDRDGQLVDPTILGGTLSTTSGPPPFIVHAFLYRDGRMVDLGTLGGELSAARDINNAGQIVGIAETADGDIHPFVWQDGVMRDLEVSGLGLGINRAGHVLGMQFSPNSLGAFVWQQGELRDVGLPPGAEAVLPIELNDAGQVLVRAFDMQNPRMMPALVWQDGAWVRQFDPRGQPEFFAFAMNNAGQVLGVSRADGANFHGVLWDANDNRRDLANLTCGASVGWKLGPQAINDVGQIVGYAVQGHTLRAFLLTPPRP